MLKVKLHTEAELDPPQALAIFAVMLQHNSARAGRRAHVAHAAVVGLHTLCCGLPALALMAAALSGAASSVALLSETTGQIHDFMHRHEIWVLVVSAVLVVSGGYLEFRARKSGHAHAFPWLFAISVFCFVLNIVIIAVHRG